MRPAAVVDRSGATVGAARAARSPRAASTRRCSTPTSPGQRVDALAAELRRPRRALRLRHRIRPRVRCREEFGDAPLLAKPFGTEQAGGDGAAACCKAGADRIGPSPQRTMPP